MIEARGLSKRYGDKVAVDYLSCTVRPGQYGRPASAGASPVSRNPPYSSRVTTRLVRL